MVLVLTLRLHPRHLTSVLSDEVLPPQTAAQLPLKRHLHPVRLLVLPADLSDGNYVPEAFLKVNLLIMWLQGQMDPAAGAE